MTCEGRYSHLPPENITIIRQCDYKKWEQAIEKSKLEHQSVIASRCYTPNNKTWVYFLKYNSDCNSSISEKLIQTFKKYNFNRLKNMFYKIAKCKYVGYTYLINENLADINNVLLIHYLQNNYSNYIKKIDYFFEEL